MAVPVKAKSILLYTRRYLPRAVPSRFGVKLTRAQWPTAQTFKLQICKTTQAQAG